VSRDEDETTTSSLQQQHRLNSVEPPESGYTTPCSEDAQLSGCDQGAADQQLVIKSIFAPCHRVKQPSPPADNNTTADVAARVSVLTTDDGGDSTPDSTGTASLAAYLACIVPPPPSSSCGTGDLRLLSSSDLAGARRSGNPAEDMTNVVEDQVSALIVPPPPPIAPGVGTAGSTDETPASTSSNNGGVSPAPAAATLASSTADVSPHYRAKSASSAASAPDVMSGSCAVTHVTSPNNASPMSIKVPPPLLINTLVDVVKGTSAASLPATGLLSSQPDVVIGSCTMTEAGTRSPVTSTVAASGVVKVAPPTMPKHTRKTSSDTAMTTTTTRTRLPDISSASYDASNNVVIASRGLRHDDVTTSGSRDVTERQPVVNGGVDEESVGMEEEMLFPPPPPLDDASGLDLETGRDNLPPPPPPVLLLCTARGQPRFDSVDCRQGEYGQPVDENLDIAHWSSSSSSSSLDLSDNLPPPPPSVLNAAPAASRMTSSSSVVMTSSSVLMTSSLSVEEGLSAELAAAMLAARLRAEAIDVQQPPAAALSASTGQILQLKR